MESFKITVINFFKYNEKVKKSHPCFMLSKRIFSDESVSNLRPIEFQLYLYLITVAADLAQDQYTLSAKSLPRYFRIRTHSLHNYLRRLQQFQLVRVENNESLIELEKNRIEKNRIEIEKNVSSEVGKPIRKPLQKVQKEPVEKFVHTFSEKHVAEFDKKLYEHWVKEFGEDFVCEEFKKITAWILSNPTKAPKSAWGKFVNSWLYRGYERKRVSTKPEFSKKSKADQMMDHFQKIHDEINQPEVIS